MQFLRLTFIVFAFASVVLGIAKLTVAGMLWTRSSVYRDFKQVNYRAEISGATFSGLLDVSFALFGLYAIAKYNLMLMYLFSMNTGLVCVAKTAHVYLCYHRFNKFKSIIKEEVQTLWIKYNYLAKAIDVTTRVQSQLSCCGASDASSWARPGMKTLPKSCCDRELKLPICTADVAFRKGCFQALLETVEYDWMKFLLSVSVPVLEVLMLIIGCVYSINEIRAGSTLAPYS